MLANMFWNNKEHSTEEHNTSTDWSSHCHSFSSLKAHTGLFQLKILLHLDLYLFLFLNVHHRESQANEENSKIFIINSKLRDFYQISYFLQSLYVSHWIIFQPSEWTSASVFYLSTVLLQSIGSAPLLRSDSIN